MTRVRVSTTVDGDVLAAIRARLGVSDSELLDRALRVLFEQVEAEAERAALLAQPYETDPDLAWENPDAPIALAYDGDVPAHVLELARARRRGA